MAARLPAPAPQLALKPVEGGEDETRQFGVLSKQETGDRHHFATGSGAHASNYQRDTEEGNRCELTLPVAKDSRRFIVLADERLSAFWDLSKLQVLP
jgi:hypothetical protein